MAKLGFASLLQFIGLLSVNLAVVNFLPIPALDGGRFLFIVVERLRGRSIRPKLEAIMKEWFKIHPGGQFTIVVPANLANSRNKHPVPSPLTPDQAHDHFHRTLNGSKWKVLKGWHVLRHSFCSNCARNGVPDSIIDAWMGHRGDEDIKKRYRHLFPSDTRGFMRGLFNDPPVGGRGS